MSKPPNDRRTNEQYYFDVLKRISKYDPPERIHRIAEKAHYMGLDDAREAIEYAYENVITEAGSAIKGMRRPKDKKPTPAIPADGDRDGR